MSLVQMIILKICEHAMYIFAVRVLYLNNVAYVWGLNNKLKYACDRIVFVVDGVFTSVHTVTDYHCELPD
jgi:hypothetical protein